MARCVCPRGDCKCKVVAGVGVQVKGVGSENQPFVVASAPTVYDVGFGPSSPPFYVNGNQSKVGSQTLFVVEVASGAHGVIVLPEGSSAYPSPARGAVLDFLVSGEVGQSSVGWGTTGGFVVWAGAEPTVTDLGWYRFTFGGFPPGVGVGLWFGEYVGAHRT